MFFEHLVEFCEELRISNHLNVENYTIKKLFYLLEVNDKIKTRIYLDSYQLHESLLAIINSPDKKTSKKANEALNKLKESYYNGRRIS